MATGLASSARSVQSKGRGYDDHLVHMSGKELEGLQALAQQHGGSLTINPETGLYEAGFLSDILPTIVGAGLTMMGVPAWGAALGGGLAGYADKGTLAGGVAGALGGWGGSGLYTGLAGAGIESLAPAFGAAPADAAAALATSNPYGLTPFTSQMSAMPGATTANAMMGPYAGIDALQSTASLTGADTSYLSPIVADSAEYMGMYPAPTPDAAMPVASRETALLSRAEQAANMPKSDLLLQGAKRIGSDFVENPRETFNKYKTPLLAAAAPMLMSAPYSSAGAPSSATPTAAQRRDYTYKAPEPVPGAPGQYYNPYFLPRAAGGIVGLAKGGSAELPARMVRGPGDGVSDSVPALINGQRPAAMADGEFVVPARIVSELGNGSTDAGAKRLYAMMDRVQKARGKTVGKGKVAVDSKARKMLPV